MKLTYKLSGLNPTVVRSSDLTELGSSWYISIVPFGGLPANFSLTVTQRCQLPFGELAPIIHTVPSSVEGFFQLVPIRIDLPFELELSVPSVGSSALVTIHYEPTPYIPTFTMSGQSNPHPGSVTDPALLQAVTMLVQTTAQTAAAVQSSDENLFNYDNTAYEVSLSAPVFTFAGNVNRIAAIDPKCRELVISNNNATGFFKLMTVAPADGAPYSAITNITGNPIAPGGSFVLNEPTSRDEWFVVGSVANMKVNVTKSAKL